MQIVIITPVRSSSRSGNGTTALRWAHILRELGHEVRVANKWNGAPADLMVALHAWRSADSVRRFREVFPCRPLIVALSGTDIYEYIERDPEPTPHFRLRRSPGRLAKARAATPAAAISTKSSRRAPICSGPSYRTEKDKQVRRGGDRALAQGQGSNARGACRAQSAKELAHPHRAYWSRRDPALEGSGGGRDETQSTLYLARRQATRAGPAPAWPRQGHGAAPHSAKAGQT